MDYLKPGENVIVDSPVSISYPQHKAYKYGLEETSVFPPPGQNYLQPWVPPPVEKDGLTVDDKQKEKDKNDEDLNANDDIDKKENEYLLEEEENSEEVDETPVNDDVYHHF